MFLWRGGYISPNVKLLVVLLGRDAFLGAPQKGEFWVLSPPTPPKKPNFWASLEKRGAYGLSPNKTTRYKKFCLDFTFIYFLFTFTPRCSFYFQCSLAESLTCHSLLCLILSNFNLLFPFSTETHFPCFPCSGDGGTPGETLHHDPPYFCLTIYGDRKNG